MRLLSLGAFPYPHHQGSQVYLQEQAIALRAAGVEVELLTYASGLDPGADLARWRALDGFVQHVPPRWSAPRGLASGPSLAKPLADLALARKLRAVVAAATAATAATAEEPRDGGSRRGFDAILAHNVEAALVALHALPRGAPPVVYCVHTLLEHEASAYLIDRAWGPRDGSRLARGIDRLGRGIDRHLARRCAGWLALAGSAAEAMRRVSVAPGAVVPPPLPDPRPALDTLTAEAIARRHGLEPGGFFLYSGNLDGYQELALLGRAAQQRPAPQARATPIVVASHDPRVSRDGLLPAHVVGRLVKTSREMNALLSVARASLVPRRARGGFPIKLLNSLALGTPAVTSLGRDWGLEDGVDGLIYPADRPEQGLVEALVRLSDDDDLARRLRSGARARYEQSHRPELVAASTIELIERVI